MVEKNGVYNATAITKKLEESYYDNQKQMLQQNQLIDKLLSQIQTLKKG